MDVNFWLLLVVINRKCVYVLCTFIAVCTHLEDILNRIGQGEMPQNIIKSLEKTSKAINISTLLLIRVVINLCLLSTNSTMKI